MIERLARPVVAGQHSRMNEQTPLTKSLRPQGATIAPQPVTQSALETYAAGPAYRELMAYFADYPVRSLMSAQNRAILFGLIRMMRPKVVAEIGTLFAGTTEVMARALWENGAGVIHTTDPYGGERCPGVIAAWPHELREITHYYPLNSMGFFNELDQHGVVVDIALVDGDHNYEPALFDLQMAARLLRPGGIVIMDNAEQTGPFHAARTFVARNPAWRELGGAINAHDPGNPFVKTRASLPETSFLILQSPPHLTIGEGPHSWGPLLPIDASYVGGLLLELPAQRAAGTLLYRVFARGFADGNRFAHEVQTTGSLRLALDGVPVAISHLLPEPLTFEVPKRYTEARFYAEIELSWLADPGSPALALSAVPVALGRSETERTGSAAPAA
jgi:predicted O-methyltransferase YrrM